MHSSLLLMHIKAVKGWQPRASQQLRVLTCIAFRQGPQSRRFRMRGRELRLRSRLYYMTLYGHRILGLKYCYRRVFYSAGLRLTHRLIFKTIKMAHPNHPMTLNLYCQNNTNEFKGTFFPLSSLLQPLAKIPSLRVTPSQVTSLQGLNRP